MNAFETICLPWLDEQVEDGDDLDYFELASRLPHTDAEIVDLYYQKLLSAAKKYRHMITIVQKCEENMTVSLVPWCVSAYVTLLVTKDSIKICLYYYS